MVYSQMNKLYNRELNIDYLKKNYFNLIAS